jgi:hypothetical protein
MVVGMNNPPAFPLTSNWHNELKHYNGMGLRDYMAAKALQGYISARGWHPDFTYPADFNFEAGKRAADAVAAASYQYADAMLAAREK